MRNAEKVSVTMTSEQMQVIRETVQSGEFASTSEAMRDAVRVWQRQRIEDAERLEAIRARVRRSINDPRPSLSADEAEAELTRFMESEAKGLPDAAH
jgi:antitoxin ParD1/3/4